MRDVNEKAETAENTGVEEAAENTEEKKTLSAGKPDEEDNAAKRKNFLWLVAGIYLIYTAYGLGDSYFKKEEGSSLGFFLAGIAFGIIGVYLIYRAIRDYLRAEKQKKAEAAALQTAGEESAKVADGKVEAGKTVVETASRKETVQPKKMSISQRAHLVESLEETENVQEQPKV